MTTSAVKMAEQTPGRYYIVNWGGSDDHDPANQAADNTHAGEGWRQRRDPIAVHDCTVPTDDTERYLQFHGEAGR